MPAYVIGVDGGGSKTIAVAANYEGEVIAIARSGPSNYQTIGVAAARESIAACLKGILTRVGPEAECRAAFYALAGADRPADFAVIESFLAPLNPAPRWKIENDALAALALVSEDGTGVVVVCGTGTNCIGIDPQGNRVQIGGLGRIFGDRAGGTEIATLAYAAAVRSEDGRGRPTILASLLRQHLGLAHLEDLADKLFASPCRFNLATLVPVVFKAAEAGDEVAQEILRETGKELGISALAALRRLFPKEAKVKVVLTGGITKGPNTIVEEAMRAVVHAEYPAAEIVIPDTEPVLGAVLGAFRLDGVVLAAAMVQKLKTSFARRERNETPILGE